MPRILRRPYFLGLLVATFALSAFVTAPAASGAATASELTTTVASVGDGNAALSDATTQEASVSAEGRYVAFATKASNAAPGYVHDGTGNPTGTDVFVHDNVAKTTTLVSATAADKNKGGNGDSHAAVISGDGRWVAFVSSATNLITDQVANVNPQVFLRDLKTGTTTYVSAKTGSTTTGGDAAAIGPSISSDGSKIAFTSAATDVAASFVVGSAGKTNVFVRDRVAAANTLASPSRTDKNKGANDSSNTSPGSIGADGQTVAFTSLATDLVADFTDNNGGSGSDVFTRTLAVGSTALVSGKGGSPSASSNGASAAPAASSDGRAIAFQSSGTDLVGSFVDGNTAGNDVFLRDTEAQTTSLLSHKAATPLTGSNQDSTLPSISGDGNLVSFLSLKNSDLGAEGTPSDFLDVYVHNVNLDTVVRASVSTAGVAQNGTAYDAALALDGHSVVYASGATNLVSPASTNPPQVFRTQLLNPGYWLDASDGGIFAFGPADVTPPFYGSTGAMTLNKPMVGMAPYADGLGYWLVASDGGIFSFHAPGHANLFFGSTGAIHLNKPIVGMAAFPNGKGYWLVASDGGIFTFGDADFYQGKELPFFGSTGAIHLNKPIVGMAAFPNGKGYWLVASDGGIFTFGDSSFYKNRQLPFFGSTGAITLNQPIVGLAAFPNGRGYWLVASDGGIFTFGDSSYYTTSFPLPFYGSTGAIHLNQPIVGMASTSTGMGYWLVASDGGIFAFGDAPFFGSTGAIKLNQPIVGMAAR